VKILRNQQNIKNKKKKKEKLQKERYVIRKLPSLSLEEKDRSLLEPEDLICYQF